MTMILFRFNDHDWELNTKFNGFNLLWESKWSTVGPELINETEVQVNISEDTREFTVMINRVLTYHNESSLPENCSTHSKTTVIRKYTEKQANELWSLACKMPIQKFEEKGQFYIKALIIADYIAFLQ